MMDYYGYGMHSYGFGLIDFIVHVAVWVFIIWLVLALLRGFGGSRRSRRWHMWQTHDALGILNERFAKGEINKEEYEERKKTLLAEVK